MRQLFLYYHIAYIYQIFKLALPLVYYSIVTSLHPLNDQSVISWHTAQTAIKKIVYTDKKFSFYEYMFLYSLSTKYTTAMKVLM